MEPVTIKPCVVADIEHEPMFAALLDEYARESAIRGLPLPSAQIETYKLIENAGGLRLLAAYQGDVLIGFLVLLLPVLPHYGVMVATTESFFVGSAYRKTGAGMKLLHEAEHLARDRGAAGILVSAPINGRLAEVLEKTDYRETNRVFFRGFA